MAWWVWVLIGLGLATLELLEPEEFHLFFFGVGALAVGGLVAAGIAGPLWVQLLWFVGLSVGSLVLLRARLRALLRGAEGPRVGVEALIGEIAVVAEDLEPGAIGRAELRGTTWTVRNRGSRRLQQGQRCRVRRVDGLLLEIDAE